MKKRRTPAHRVNKRQRALAIKVLTSIVESPDVAEYVRQKAAQTLLQGDPDAPDTGSVVERDPDAPRKYVVLPDNGRNPHVRYGLYDEGQLTAVVPAGWPSEIRPESDYASVERPGDLLAARRAKLLPAAELYGADAP